VSSALARHFSATYGRRLLYCSRRIVPIDNPLFDWRIIVEIERQLHTEIAIINSTLASFGVDAGTRPQWTTIAGASFVAYGLRTGAAQRISDIARLLPELSERLSAVRRRPTPVRLREMPLALEVAHPTPAPLGWRLSTLRIGAGRVVAGRNYSANPAQDCVIDLDARPQLLVAGTTGSGKSTVLRMLLASLAYNAAPDDLRLVLIDRKNEDLVPFARLPHVEFAAWTADDARAAIHRVYAEISRRTDDGRIDRTRLVLVVDELAQVDADALDILARHIVPVGRSKRVHVIAATQHPAVRLIGDKANYSVRLVGQVMDAQTAALATGRKGSGAELLPGSGAFLCVDGVNLDRLQAYNLHAAAAAALVQTIGAKWCDAPVRTGAPLVAPLPAPQTSVPPPVRTGAMFPLPRRAPTPSEAAEIRSLHAAGGSLNQLIVAVYGSKSSDTHRWVREALEAPEPAPILRIGVRA
jgi:energy-coupling factor transporter ATP-binding protein EcfA2